jgi:RNA polymerase sigma-70 factor, ECF subfamily
VWEARTDTCDDLLPRVGEAYPSVWRYCAGMAGTAEANDLAQETFARALRDAPRFRAESTVTTWLIGIARHVCLDHIRSSQRRRARDSMVLPSQPLPVGPDHSERIAIRLLVNTLDADQREAFVLTQMLGLTYDEAAEISRCPVGTIRSRVNRARSHLIELIDADTEQPPGDMTVVSQRGLPWSR